MGKLTAKICKEKGKIFKTTLQYLTIWYHFIYIVTPRKSSYGKMSAIQNRVVDDADNFHLAEMLHLSVSWETINSSRHTELYCLD